MSLKTNHCWCVSYTFDKTYMIRLSLTVFFASGVFLLPSPLFYRDLNGFIHSPLPQRIYRFFRRILIANIQAKLCITNFLILISLVYFCGSVLCCDFDYCWYLIYFSSIKVVILSLSHAFTFRRSRYTLA